MNDFGFKTPSNFFHFTLLKTKLQDLHIEI